MGLIRGERLAERLADRAWDVAERWLPGWPVVAVLAAVVVAAAVVNGQGYVAVVFAAVAYLCWLVHVTERAAADLEGELDDVLEDVDRFAPAKAAAAIREWHKVRSEVGL
ncbi:MAG: hypothetical protein ACRDYU_03845 [Actinomycetes bacterium]